MSGTHLALLELYIASKSSLWNVRIHSKPLVASTLLQLSEPQVDKKVGALGQSAGFGLNGSALLPLATRGQLASFPVSSGEVGKSSLRAVSLPSSRHQGSVSLGSAWGHCQETACWEERLPQLNMWKWPWRHWRAVACLWPSKQIMHKMISIPGLSVLLWSTVLSTVPQSSLFIYPQSWRIIASPILQIGKLKLREVK